MSVASPRGRRFNPGIAAMRLDDALEGAWRAASWA